MRAPTLPRASAGGCARRTVGRNTVSEQSAWEGCGEGQPCAWVLPTSYLLVKVGPVVGTPRFCTASSGHTLEAAHDAKPTPRGEVFSASGWAAGGTVVTKGGGGSGAG